MQKAKNNVLLTCRELTGFHGLEKSEEYSVMPSYDHKIKKEWLPMDGTMLSHEKTLDIQQIFSSDMLLIINFLNGLLFHV